MRAQSVAAALRHAVSAGEYSPGEKLNEVTTADRFSVSRNTLRESFALLDADGIIDRIPNRGVFIATPTAESVRDLYRAREIIEPGALLWGPALDTAALDGMETAVRSAEAGLTAGDFTAVGLGNQKFHRAVVFAAGSTLLDDEVDRLLARMRLAFLLAERANPEFHRPFVAVNRSITELVATGDRTAAADRLRASISTTGAELEQLVGLFHAG